MDTKSYKELINEIESLKQRLNEAEQTVEAIRNGTVDAFIVNGDSGPELYTLKSADLTYRLFIEKMAEGAVTLNKNGLVLYANSSFAGMLGQPLSHILGMPLKAIIPEEYSIIINQLIHKAWQEECRAEITLPGLNNSAVPVLISMNALDTNEGPALSMIVTDISSQKEAMKQRKAIEQKDEFISIASHELKTPVTSIKGYIQLLGLSFDKEGNADAVALLHKADNQVNKLANLINELLDVKKIETGQLEYHQISFDFNELVNEIIEEIEMENVLNGHTIHAKLNTTSVVYGDRNKIGQVIINLLDNARKYSPPGSPIEVKTESDKKVVKLYISDSGIGIPKEQQSRIFERFFRVKGEKENTYAGLGLGLYISSEIIRRHNGIIGVESEKDKGSVFYFELPLYDNDRTS